MKPIPESTSNPSSSSASEWAAEPFDVLGTWQFHDNFIPEPTKIPDVDMDSIAERLQGQMPGVIEADPPEA